MSSATPLAYTNPVEKGRKCGTIEVNSAGSTRWMTPLTEKAAATNHGPYEFNMVSSRWTWLFSVTVAPYVECPGTPDQ